MPFQIPPAIVNGSLFVDDDELTSDQLSWSPYSSQRLRDGRTETVSSKANGQIGSRWFEVILGYNEDLVPFFDILVGAPNTKELRCTFDFAEVQA